MHCFTMSFIVLLGVSCLLNVISTEKIEDFFRCHRKDPNFNECARSAANDFHKFMANGIPELNIRKADPLFIDKMVIDKVEGMKFKQVLTNMTIIGLKDSKLIKADYTKLPNNYELHFEIPKLAVDNYYTMDSVIMGVPFKGKGQSFFNATGWNIKMKIKTELVNKDGEDYLHVTDVRYTSEPPKTASLKFTNELSKDKKLDQAMAKFFNENWRAMYELFKNVRNEHAENLIKTTMNKVYSKYPYNKIFPE